MNYDFLISRTYTAHGYYKEAVPLPRFPLHNLYKDTY